MAVKTFNISFPKPLADQIDKKAKEQFGSRSDFLRAAAIEYLRKEEKIDQLKKLMTEIRKNAKNIPFESEEEVAEYFTNQRRKKEAWRQNVAEFKRRSRR